MVVIYMVVIKFNLPLIYLVVGRVINGVTGYQPATIALCLAYYADTNSREKRVAKMAFADIFVSVAAGLGKLIGGPWIEVKVSVCY